MHFDQIIQRHGLVFEIQCTWGVISRAIRLRHMSAGQPRPLGLTRVPLHQVVAQVAHITHLLYQTTF